MRLSSVVPPISRLRIGTTDDSQPPILPGCQRISGVTLRVALTPFKRPPFQLCSWATAFDRLGTDVLPPVCSRQIAPKLGNFSSIKYRSPEGPQLPLSSSGQPAPQPSTGWPLCGPSRYLRSPGQGSPSGCSLVLRIACIL